MKTTYSYQNGLLKFEFDSNTHSHVLCINHPVIYYGSYDNEFEEKEQRLKLSFNTSASFIKNRDLDYWYGGFMVFGFGIGISRQLV